MYIDIHYFEYKENLQVLQFLATQPFMPNCLHSSRKCPGLGKNENELSLLKLSKLHC